MATDGRKGRAGPALAAAGLGSFFAGWCRAVIIAAFAAAADRAGIQVRARQYFSLMVLGLIGAVVLPRVR